MGNVEAGEVVADGAQPSVQSDLNILDLGSILQSLGANRRSGTLKVIRPSGDYALIYLKNGMICLANSAQAGLSILAEAMIKYRKMTPADLEAIGQAAVASGQTVIQVIAAQERLSEQDLERFIVTLAFERTADVLSWKDVHCEFSPDTIVEPELDPSLAEFCRGVPVDGVLLEAARRADEWDSIQGTFDPVSEVFEMVRELPEHISNPAQQELARFVDGYRDVGEVVALSSLNSFDACIVLLDMVQNGYVKTKRAGELIQLGGTAAAKGDWTKALKLYRRAQVMDRERSDLPVRIAAAYEALGNVEQAREHLLVFVRESMAAKRFPEAGRACERLVELDPEEPEHRAKLFRCLLETGPASHLSEVGRALLKLYEKRGTLDRATDVLAKLREMHPDEPALTEIDARIRLATAERTEALIEYEKLAECLIQVDRIDESVAEYTKLAEILTRTGVFDESVNLPFVLKVQRRVAELDPSNTSSREWLAETFADRGNRKEALAEFDQLLDIYTKTEQRAKYRETLERISGFFPEELAYRERLAQVYLREEGGAERGRAEMKSLCRAAWQQEDFSLGTRVAEKLLEMDPFYMEAHVLLGEVMLARGEREAALEKMLSAALMYMGAGMLEEAETVLTEVVQHEDGSVDAHRFLGAILEERGMIPAAADHYKKVGRLCIARYDFGTARDHLLAARELNPGDPEIDEALSLLPADMAGE
ncbi:MAG: DUF4388 domain-containing protein [Planctomycetota bacterium]